MWNVVKWADNIFHIWVCIQDFCDGFRCASQFISQRLLELARHNRRYRWLHRIYAVHECSKFPIFTSFESLKATKKHQSDSRNVKTNHNAAQLNESPLLCCDIHVLHLLPFWYPRSLTIFRIDVSEVQIDWIPNKQWYLALRRVCNWSVSKTWVWGDLMSRGNLV